MHKRELYILKFCFYIFLIISLTACSYDKIVSTSFKNEYSIKNNTKQAIKILKAFKYEAKTFKEDYHGKVVVIVKKKLIGDREDWFKKLNNLRLIRDDLKSLTSSSISDKWKDDLDFLLCFLNLNLQGLFSDIYDSKKENPFLIDFRNSTEHFINTEYVDTKIEPSTKEILKDLFWNQFEKMLTLSFESKSELNEIDRIKGQFQLIMATELMGIGHIKKGEGILRDIIQKYPNSGLANSANTVMQLQKNSGLILKEK